MIDKKFEQCSRSKVRFEVGGLVTAEDLWDTPLSQLDSYALQLEQQINSLPRKSFIHKQTEVDPILQLKFDIVTHIIQVRLEEQERAEQKAKRIKELSNQKQRVLQAKYEKANQQISEASIEMLDQQLAEIEAELSQY